MQIGEKELELDDQQIKQIVGNNIRKARESLGWSQAELANRFDKDPSTVSAYEAGSRTVRITDLPRLAELLKVPVAYFFNSDDVTDDIIDVVLQLPPSFKKYALVNISQLLDDLNTLRGEGLKIYETSFLVLETDDGQRNYFPVTEGVDQKTIKSMIEKGWALLEE